MDVPVGVCNTGVLFFDVMVLQRFLHVLPEASAQVDALNPFIRDRFIDSLYFVAAVNKANLAVEPFSYSLNYMAFFERYIVEDTGVTNVVMAHFLHEAEFYCTLDPRPSEGDEAVPADRTVVGALQRLPSASMLTPDGGVEASDRTCRCVFNNEFYLESLPLIAALQALDRDQNCLFLAGAIPLSMVREANQVAKEEVVQKEGQGEEEGEGEKGSMARDAGAEWRASHEHEAKGAAGAAEGTHTPAWVWPVDGALQHVYIGQGAITRVSTMAADTNTRPAIHATCEAQRDRGEPARLEWLRAPFLSSSGTWDDEPGCGAIAAMACEDMGNGMMIWHFEIPETPPETCMLATHATTKARLLMGNSPIAILTMLLLDRAPASTTIYAPNSLLGMRSPLLESQAMLPAVLNTRPWLRGTAVSLCCDRPIGVATTRALVDQWMGRRMLILIHAVPAGHPGGKDQLVAELSAACRSARHRKGCLVVPTGRLKEAAVPFLPSLAAASVDVMYVDRFPGHDAFVSGLYDALQALAPRGMLIGSTYVDDATLGPQRSSVTKFAHEVRRQVLVTFGERSGVPAWYLEKLHIRQSPPEVETT